MLPNPAELAQVADIILVSNRGGPACAAMAGLSAEQKAVVRKMATAIQAEKDAAKLQAQLKSIEDRMAQEGAKTPPIAKALRALLVKRLKELDQK